MRLIFHHEDIVGKHYSPHVVQKKDSYFIYIKLKYEEDIKPGYIINQ